MKHLLQFYFYKYVKINCNGLYYGLYYNTRKTVDITTHNFDSIFF